MSLARKGGLLAKEMGGGGTGAAPRGEDPSSRPDRRLLTQEKTRGATSPSRGKKRKRAQPSKNPDQ